MTIHLSDRLPRVHCCPFDKTCRSVGAPARLQLQNATHHLGIALLPSAKFGNQDGSSSWIDFRAL